MGLVTIHIKQDDGMPLGYNYVLLTGITCNGYERKT